MRRGTRSSGPDVTARVVWQAASVLLGYPDATVIDRLPMVAAAVETLPGDVGRPLRQVLDYVITGEVGDLAEAYVRTFDLARRHTLYLTYYTAGDTRNRGVALLEFSDTYRAAGVEPPSVDLPDHLPTVLEFAATVDPARGYQLLASHRAPLALLHAALTKSGSAYAGAVQAVLTTLPTATQADLHTVHQLAVQGPPAESVGLEPFATTIPVRRSVS